MLENNQYFFNDRNVEQAIYLRISVMAFLHEDRIQMLLDE